ncbi:MAG TPA: twin-arginine translocase subunit TatC, partial [Ktedonobacteraceae bacterium]|nr:twin-arginine translocase subunit TatC [Ktedonobacteraceae bacterium]
MATRNIDQDEYSIDEEEELDDSSMSLVEHLEELRWRILKSLIAIVVGGIVAFIFRQPIMHFLTYPLPKTADAALHGDRLIVTGLAEGFTVYLKLSFAVGFLIALPVILYQVWAFVSP